MLYCPLLSPMLKLEISPPLLPDLQLVFFHCNLPEKTSLEEEKKELKFLKKKTIICLLEICIRMIKRDGFVYLRVISFFPIHSPFSVFWSA